MIFTCHCCKTDCPSLGQWHEHLLSEGHQAAVREAATATATSGLVKEDYSQPEMMTGTTTIFLLQPSDSSEARPRHLEETLVKFASLGFVHDFYVHSNSNGFVVNLERRDGLSHERVIQESEGFGFFATPFLASTPKDWHKVILRLYNNGDEMVHRLDAAVEIKEGGNLKTLSLPASLEASRPPWGSSNSNGLNGQESNTKTVLETDKRTMTDVFDENFLRQFEDAQLTQAQLDERRGVLFNLECCLGTWFSNLDIQLHSYGSFVTGLGDQSSNLDVTMTGHEIMEVSGLELAKEVHEVLTKYRVNGRAPFRGVRLVQWPVELLRFTDDLTGISCDLGFGKLLAIRNSELIAFIVSLDPRIRQLVLLVRRWGKFYNISGSKKLKNYTIALLVLVFLARKNFIPTIWTLQSLVEQEVVGGWNAGFSQDPEAIENLLGSYRSAEEANYHANATLLQLTRDFFNFFATENFTDNFLCCLTAEFIPERFFESLETIQEYRPYLYERFRRQMEFAGQFVGVGKKKFLLKKKVLNVQDPFNLAVNLGKSVNRKVLRRLLHIVKNTAEYFSSSSSFGLDLFPTFDYSDEPRQVETEEEGLSAEVLVELSLLLELSEEGNLILEEIEDKKCRKLKFRLDQEFTDIFSEFASGGLMNPNQTNLMHQLWLKFAKLYIARVWSHCYLLHCDSNVILDQELEDEEGVVFCSNLDIHGLRFPAGLLFKLRHETKKDGVVVSGLEDPLEEERTVRLRAGKGFNILKFKCLAVLSNDKELGPHFTLFNTGFHREAFQPVKNMLNFVTTGIKKSFPRYQIHLLRKWIANGQNLNLL